MNLTGCRIERPCRNTQFTFKVILSPSLRSMINSAKNPIMTICSEEEILRLTLQNDIAIQPPGSGMQASAKM